MGLNFGWVDPLGYTSYLKYKNCDLLVQTDY